MTFSFETQHELAVLSIYSEYTYGDYMAKRLREWTQDQEIFGSNPRLGSTLSPSSPYS